MRRIVDCPSRGERDTCVLYLAGKLSETEAHEFEEHYFSCPECREDVHRGGELRAAVGKLPVVPAAAARGPGRTWLPLAAAAVIAFVGIGVWQFTRRTAEEAGRPVMRGASTEVLDLKVATGRQGGFDLTWPSRPEAATYVVHVFASNGASVWTTDTRESRLSIGPAVLPALGATQTYLIRVEALDSMGQVVAKSALTALPRP